MTEQMVRYLFMLAIMGHYGGAVVRAQSAAQDLVGLHAVSHPSVGGCGAISAETARNRCGSTIERQLVDRSRSGVSVPLMNRPFVTPPSLDARGFGFPFGKNDGQKWLLATLSIKSPRCAERPAAEDPAPQTGEG